MFRGNLWPCFWRIPLAGALGPLVMGAGFDLTDSYRAPLAVLLISASVGAVLMTKLWDRTDTGGPLRRPIASRFLQVEAKEQT